VAASVTVTGIAELQNKLGRIEDPKRNKAAIRSTVGAGATVIRKALRAEMRSHNRTGSAFDAINWKVKIYPSGNILAVIGVRRGHSGVYYSRSGKKIVPANYWHLLNEGTRPHMQPKAHRLISVNGRRVLAPVGPQVHPGSRPANIRSKAIAKSRVAANAAMAKRYQKRVLAEATR